MNQSADLEFSRFTRAASLTLLTSVAAVLAIRQVAVAVLTFQTPFGPLTLFPPLFDTMICTSVAIFVFWEIGQYSSTPVSTFRKVAAGVLVVSFAPDVCLAVWHWFGGGWPEAIALMLMHVVVWAICVTMLPHLVSSRNR